MGWGGGGGWGVLISGGVYIRVLTSGRRDLKLFF